MRSRFDYADPGTDSDYCDGLSPEPEPTDTTVDDIPQDDTPEPTEYEGPTCYFCSGPCLADEIYCSALCACYAARDNAYD